jgi:hypothetical protein
MTTAYWGTLIDISLVAKQDNGAELGSKAGPLLAATAETLADILPTAKADILMQGFSEATAAMAAIKRIAPVDEKSADFIAGQLAVIADILGYAASATADEDQVRKATQPPYIEILSALSNDALRTVDLAALLGTEKSCVSSLLYEMRTMGVIASHQRGREVYNTLTPIGRLISN